jgi:hypothetical protein
MNDIVSELKAIWAKYEPHREAERREGDVSLECARRLDVENAWRTEHGFPTLVPWYCVPSMNVTQPTWTVTTVTNQKAWRDSLDAELLAAVKWWLEGRVYAVPK